MGRGKHRKKGKVLYEYVPPKVEYIYNTEFDLCIKKSRIKNSGLFSNMNISKNTYLGNYIGELKKPGQYV